MAQRDIFPDLDVEAVLEATRKHWDWSAPWPVPRGDWIRCGVCGGTQIQGRQWTRIVQPGHAIEGRINVSTKCTGCAAVQIFGVAVPPDHLARFGSRLNRHIGWRQVQTDNQHYLDNHQEDQ